MTPRRRLLIAGAIVVGVVLLDVLTKDWALRALADGPRWIVDRSVGFVLAFNSGSAFSVVRSGTPVLAAIAVVAAVILIRTVLRTDDPWLVVGLSLVLAGAIGNLLDRVFRGGTLFHGSVIDFVKVGPWPLFNVADSAITVGAIIIIVRIVLDGRGPADAPAVTEPGESS